MRDSSDDLLLPYEMADELFGGLLSKRDKAYDNVRNKFAASFERYLNNNSPAEKSRMKVYSQEMIDILTMKQLDGIAGPNDILLSEEVDAVAYSFREARQKVEKDLNSTKANIYDRLPKKETPSKVSDKNGEFDNSSSRMKLRPFDGQRLNIEGTVDTIEFADHDGQMQATIKNVSVATPNGTVRYNHVNFFVDDALGDVLLSRQGSKVAFSGKVTLYDRGHRSTDKGSAAKAYGFSDIRVK